MIFYNFNYLKLKVFNRDDGKRTAITDCPQRAFATRFRSSCWFEFEFADADAKYYYCRVVWIRVPHSIEINKISVTIILMRISLWDISDFWQIMKFESSTIYWDLCIFEIMYETFSCYNSDYLNYFLVTFFKVVNF